MNKNELQQAVDEGLSSYKIAERFGLGASTIRYWLKKYGIATIFGNKKIRRYYCKFCNKELIGANNYRRKYCDQKCISLEKVKRSHDELDMQDTLIGDIKTIKRYLLAKGNNVCAICGIDKWRGKPILLILDHINGNCDDNHRDNLRLICSNCDAQLPTYKIKNKGEGRYARRKRYQQGRSY